MEEVVPRPIPGDVFIKMKKVAAVYCIKNLITGKVYVGSSIDLYFRRIQHFSQLRCGRHENPYLQYAFDKYGEDQFKFTVLEIIDDETILIPREQHWIGELKATSRSYGYNICPFAGRPTPWTIKKHHTEETKLKMSLTKLGKLFTPEHKRRLSEARRGKKLSEEHKRHIGEANKRLYASGFVHPMKGKVGPNRGKKMSVDSIKRRTETRRANGSYGKPLTINGETHTHREWARLASISEHTLNCRILRGWDPFLAVTTRVLVRGK